MINDNNNIQTTNSEESTNLPYDTKNDIDPVLKEQYKYMYEYKNKLWQAVKWALKYRNAKPQELSDYIAGLLFEISTNYSDTGDTKASVGDIVTINYGWHLLGEVSGKKVHAIVCNFLNYDMAYVVPIAKWDYVRKPYQNYLPLEDNKDLFYSSKKFHGGYALIDKGRYINTGRIKSVIGYTSPDAFNKILKALTRAFDFKNWPTERSQFIQWQLLKNVEKNSEE